MRAFLDSFKKPACFPEMTRSRLSGRLCEPLQLRAGFVTQCALDNVPPVEGMALSLHRSEATYNRY